MTESMLQLPVYLSGFSVAAGLIVGIGPQNAFVLKQGIARQQTLAIVTVCVLCDIALISLGVAGLGQWIANWPAFISIATWGGAAFLLAYGLRAFKAAWRPPQFDTTQTATAATLRQAVLAALAFTLLNPYVYLDTVILMGSVSARFDDAARWSYWLGCITASSLWFILLGAFASRLGPLFAKPISWRVLDSLIGVIMCATAAHLVFNYGN